MSAEWHLDPRLEADTHLVARLPLSDLRLMDDARYPWLVLVPRVAGATELVDLPAAGQHALLDEIGHASHALRALVAPDKLNIAALGNVVPQLHVHVIARFRADDAWPKPVWGAHPARPYAPDALAARLRELRALLPPDACWRTGCDDPS